MKFTRIDSVPQKRKWKFLALKRKNTRKNNFIQKVRLELKFDIDASIFFYLVGTRCAALTTPF